MRRAWCGITPPPMEVADQQSPINGRPRRTVMESGMAYKTPARETGVHRASIMRSSLAPCPARRCLETRCVPIAASTGDAGHGRRHSHAGRRMMPLRPHRPGL